MDPPERGRMNPEDERTLQSNILYLKKNLDPSGVLDYLLQENIINFDQKEAVQSEKTTSDKTDKLIQILRFAGPNSFKAFLECLRKCGYKFVADYMSKGPDLRSGMEHEFVPNKTGKNPKDYKTKHLTDNNDITVQDEVYNPYQNYADGMVISKRKSTESTVMASSSVIEQKGDKAGFGETYDEMATHMYDTCSIGGSDCEDYDVIPELPDTTGLNLNNPFNDDSLQDNPSNIYKTFTELMSFPGWCPRINDTNHDKVAHSLKDGDYFIWFSQQKNAFIITLRTCQHENGCIYVKVKTRTVDSNIAYRINREFETNSLTKLFKHYMKNGLPLKYAKK